MHCLWVCVCVRVQPMSMTVMVDYIDHLLKQWSAADESTTTLLLTRQLWFVLVVNPDAYEWNANQMNHASAMARKNRRPGCAHHDDRLGVDLNRNYDIAFTVDNIGSNPSPCAEVQCQYSTVLYSLQHRVQTNPCPPNSCPPFALGFAAAAAGLSRPFPLFRARDGGHQVLD